MAFQIFHYNDVIYQYQNRKFSFNLGMISATSKPDVISTNEFYVAMDISQFLNDPNARSTSSGRRKMSADLDYSLLGNRVAITRFTVPQKSICLASLTTESGRITMNFRYGELVSWDNHAFVRNISTSWENVFVQYKQAVSNVTLVCSCIQPEFYCGGKSNYAVTDTQLPRVKQLMKFS